MKTTKRSTQARPASHGFTLIEMIVAVGAVALIAVGIAAIFESIGRTVSGGKRVSALNQYAALIERQLRADFEAMTRDGVLVVHNQYALDGQPVQLHAEDTSPRTRRIDEIVFFARGDYSSSRAPIVPGLTAEGSEAMIYIGHGQRLDPIVDDGSGNGPAYSRPEVDDGWLPVTGSGGRPYRIELALGYDDPRPGYNNPNQFAADWTLLRKVVVLAPPGGSLPNLPSSGWGTLNLTRDDALDSDIQVGGQPAMSSVFRSLAELFPRAPLFPGEYFRKAAGDTDRRPMLASGIVDAASTDLAEIRRIIMDVDQEPWNITGELQLFDPGSPDQWLLDDRYSHANGGMGAQLRFMQSWMDDLLPTHPLSGQRIRYEPTFPDFYDTVSTSTSEAAELVRLADQRALASAIFVPNCTEFIVDYSFGQIVPNGEPNEGELIWFGLDRAVTVDGNQEPVVQRYPIYARNGNSYQVDVTYTKFDGTTGTKHLTKAMLFDTQGTGGFGGGGPPANLISHFGYNDPTYAPDLTADPVVDPPTIPWPWPKLIRITITLADPNDPSIEQSFQFIFETPEGRAS